MLTSRRTGTDFESSWNNFGHIWSLLIVIYFQLASISNAQGTFNIDCTENSRFRCRVEKGCNIKNNSEVINSPSLALFDLQIFPIIMENKHLLVNVTWKASYEGSVNETQIFELHILDKTMGQDQCFSVFLDRIHWQSEDHHTPVTLRLSALDVFEYDHRYYFEVRSLLKPDETLDREITMPAYPGPTRKQLLMTQLVSAGYFDTSSVDLANSPVHCEKEAHPDASRWIAAFRQIFIQPKAGFIYIDFVAAPAQYCLEEYELRLMKNMHFIIQHTKISHNQLYEEIHENITAWFGSYTFYNVTPGVYEIGIIPIDRSEIDSRCLCPSLGQICACSQAIWPEVVMPEIPPLIGPSPDPCDHPKLSKLSLDCPNRVNETGPILILQSLNDDQSTSSASTGLITLICCLIGALIFIIAGAFITRRLYKRYKVQGIPRVYILPFGGTTDLSLKTDTMNDDTPCTEMTTILHPIKILIVYSRDCPLHESTVQAFVEYLRTQCMCQVSVDYLCTDQMDQNKFDWAYKSIADADRVLLINSYGAYMRYQAKLISTPTRTSDQQGSSVIVERADPSPYDDLFLLQLDLIYQYQQSDPDYKSKFVSVRFNYTQAHFILPHANPYVRYEIPGHFRQLVGDLHNLTQLDEDDASSLPPRLKFINAEEYDRCEEGERLKKCIENMKRYIEEYPDWFERFHVRRPIQIPLISFPPAKPSSSTPNRVEIDGDPAVPIDPVESHLPSFSLHPSWSAPTSSTQSAADSGYEETEHHTGMDSDPNRGCIIPIDQNIPLLGKMDNLDSSESGIIRDCSVGMVHDRKANGLVKGHTILNGRVDSLAIEMQRLIL